MGVLARILSLPGVFRGLHEDQLPADPVDLFARWYRLARLSRIYWPNSTALATASRDGVPSVRMVLLKSYDKEGFVFYTNYESRKGRELGENPRASMVIYWNDLLKQVRISGSVIKTSREESERYFHSRPRGSQVGAWASNQDSVMAGRQELMEKFDRCEAEFRGKPVPLPPYWGGYRLVPDEIEFWQGRAYRLHDRFRYTLADGAWKWDRLSP